MYLVRDGGDQKADFVVNGVLEKRWPSLVGNLAGGGGSGGGSTASSTSDIISLPPPHNMLSALTNTCRPAEETQSNHMGLLSAIGFTNLVNVTGLVHSKALIEGFEQGKV